MDEMPAMTEMLVHDAPPSLRHGAFLQYGEPGAIAPLVFAVPHAGRDYGEALIERARVTPGTLN